MKIKQNQVEASTVPGKSNTIKLRPLRPLENQTKNEVEASTGPSQWRERDRTNMAVNNGGRGTAQTWPFTVEADGPHKDSHSLWKQSDSTNMAVHNGGSATAQTSLYGPWKIKQNQVEASTAPGKSNKIRLRPLRRLENQTKSN